MSTSFVASLPRGRRGGWARTRWRGVAVRPAACAIYCAMAPHMTPAELDFMLAKERSGKTPIEIHGLIEARRGRKGVKPPNLAATPRSPQGCDPQARPQGNARPPVWGRMVCSCWQRAWTPGCAPKVTVACELCSRGGRRGTIPDCDALGIPLKTVGNRWKPS